MKCLYPVYITLFLLAPVLFPLPAQSQPMGYPDLGLYESQRTKNTDGTLEKRRNYLLETTPIDSLIADYARRGFDVACDTVSLFSLFEQASIQDREELRTRYDELYETARTYNSKALLRMMDFIKVWLIGQVRELNDERNQACEDLVRRCRRAGDDKLAVYTLMYMWKNYYFGQNYARSFADARRLEQALDCLGDDFPFKVGGYIQMGTAYFHFKNYDRAVALFHKGLALRGDRDLIFSMSRELLAWNSLGVYHEMRGDLDSAAYYYRTILASPEAIANGPVNLDIAICNLGRIEMARGRYDAGIAYLKSGLEHLEQNPPGINWDFAHGVYISLGECMLAKGDLPAAAQYIEKVRPGLDAFPPYTQANRLKDLFALESRYYSRLGEFGEADACLDSAKFYTERYERLAGENVITLGEQLLQETELELKSEQMARQRNIILFILIILAVVSVGTVLLIRLYRKKAAAYRSLAHKAEEWARKTDTPKPVTQVVASGTNELNGEEQPTDDDRRIMALADREMTANHAYREPGLTSEALADRLGVHRNALSRAINKSTGGNFSQYVNGHRIREAVRLLSETTGEKIYIDELFERVGFNNHTSFYRSFRQFTGLSPAEFRKNRNTWMEKSHF